jgi:uncharacterized protein
MIIPWQDLAPDTLNNIIESFILREGTDYGDVEASLAQKVDEILLLLRINEVVLVWSELHESLTIMRRADILKQEITPDR